METNLRLLLLLLLLISLYTRGGDCWRNETASTYIGSSFPVEVLLPPEVNAHPPQEGAVVFGRRCQYKMAECEVKGQAFLDRYVKRVRKDKQETKCSRYLAFRNCFVPLLSNECRHFEHAYSTWRPIIEQMDCVCKKSDECLEDQSCFLRELHGYWTSRCNDFYRFNLRQGTRDKCHFLEENFRCKEALMSSACSDRTARFATSYMELTTNRGVSKCTRNNTEYNYTDAFRYTAQCPTSFLIRIDKCTTKCLTSRNTAKFHRDNDVIVTGSRNSLKGACRSLQKYKKCLRPLEESCPAGVERVLEYGIDLRKYWIKMNFICRSDVIDVYRAHLKCYQKVMKRGFLRQCDVIWNDLRPWLENVTSYQFYCQPSHTNARNLVRQLDRLVRCHGAVFDSQCGGNASSTMVDLLKTIFADPTYLRLDYRPDCRLHAPAATAIITTTNSSTSTSAATSTSISASTSTASWYGFLADAPAAGTRAPFSMAGATAAAAAAWQPRRGSDSEEPRADYRRTDIADNAVGPLAVGAAAAELSRSRQTGGACVSAALLVLPFLTSTFLTRRFE